MDGLGCDVDQGECLYWAHTRRSLVFLFSWDHIYIYIYIYIYLQARPPSPDSITHPRTSSATLHMKTIILMCVHI